MKKLWKNCHIATMKDGKYSQILNGAIITNDDIIVWIGPEHTLSSNPSGFDQAIDLHGRWVTPAMIDCHTHAVFGGNRSTEFERRLNGVSYAEIAAQGGGINSTVNATRDTSADDLYISTKKRLSTLLKEGVMAIEIKSGYGLDIENERKMLAVARRLNQDLPIKIINTCLAAHALPPEYKDNADQYIDFVCQELLPQLAEEKLYDAVDAFCEYLAFSVEQVQRVFETARQLNIPIKIHAEQLSSQHGATMAASFNALSADHIEFIVESDCIAMAKAQTVAVLLPGAFYFLKETQRPPVDLLRKHGVKMALSTDMNPGTSPALSLRLMLNMGATFFGLTPEEALAGVTLHAAQALGLHEQMGSLETGKLANFIAWDIQHPSEITYWLGGDLPKQLIYAGEEIHYD